MASVAIVVVSTVVLATDIALGIQHRLEIHETNKMARNPMVGMIQKMPLVRECKEQAEPGEIIQEMSNDDWKQVPHIHDICHHAETGHGLIPYYWTKSLARLNKMYVDWVHSIPMDSPIHIHGNYTEIFFQLHIKYFESGVRGFMRNTFFSS